MTQLLESASLRRKISRVDQPDSQDSFSSDIIRITLGYPQNQVIQKVDAQRATLAALLSHMRQGFSGSCFASYLAIQLMKTDLKQCVEDFHSLLKNNHLCRKINEKSFYFDFTFRVAKDSCCQNICVTKNGLLKIDHQKVCFLWEAPGIQAAFLALGVENCREVLKKNLK